MHRKYPENMTYIIYLRIENHIFYYMSIENEITHIIKNNQIIQYIPLFKCEKDLNKHFTK